MPNPGTTSLPLGTSGAFPISDVVVVLVAGLGADVVPFDSVFVASVVSMFPAGREVAVAVRSCTVTDSTGARGAVVIC